MWLSGDCETPFPGESVATIMPKDWATVSQNQADNWNGTVHPGSKATRDMERGHHPPVPWPMRRHPSSYTVGGLTIAWGGRAADPQSRRARIKTEANRLR